MVDSFGQLYNRGRPPETLASARRIEANLADLDTHPSDRAKPPLPTRQTARIP